MGTNSMVSLYTYNSTKIGIQSSKHLFNQKGYSHMSSLTFVAPILFMAMLYGLGIIALVYLIKALRIYIKKNS